MSNRDLGEAKDMVPYAGITYAETQRRLTNNPDLLAFCHKKPTVEIYLAGFSLDPKELKKITGVEHYELRNIHKILQLIEDKNLELVYVTSGKIPDEAEYIDYYLDLALKRIADVTERETLKVSAKDRIHILTIDQNGSNDSLTQRLQSDTAAIKKILAITKGKQPVLRCFNTSSAEQVLATAIDTPLFGCPPEIAHIQRTKSAAKDIYKEAGVSAPFSINNVRSSLEFFDACSKFATHRDDKYVVLKLDDSFSGEGNVRIPKAVITSSIKAAQDKLSQPTVDIIHADEKDRSVIAGVFLQELAKKLETLSTNDRPKGMSGKDFLDKLINLGGIVEGWIDLPETTEGEAAHLSSPSVQIIIYPDKIQVVSTHEQIVDGQVFLGASYPASPIYRDMLIQEALKVGQTLQQKGVLGRIGIDFVVTWKTNTYTDGMGKTHNSVVNDSQSVYAIENNIRKGGTTHPFEMALHATGAELVDDGNEVFLQDSKKRRIYYLALDNILDTPYTDKFKQMSSDEIVQCLKSMEGEAQITDKQAIAIISQNEISQTDIEKIIQILDKNHSRLKGLSWQDITKFLKDSSLEFNHETNTGIIPHLLTAITAYGKFGVTCIAHSSEDAQQLYNTFRNTLREWLTNKTNES